MSRLQKLKSGIGWGVLSVGVVTFLQIIVMGILARLLNPVDFGLITIANISLQFFQHFAQLGVQPALIRKKNLDSGDIQAALALSVGVALFFFLVIFAVAPFFEQFFEMPELTLILQVMALNFIIGGFLAVSVGILRRETRFKVISQIDMVSYLLGYGVIGLTMAYYGFGVWVLVFASLSQALSKAVLCYAATRHSLRLTHNKEQRRYFLSFGGKYSLIGFMEFASIHLPHILIGKIFGASVLGIYSRASFIASLPVQQPITILNRTLFPVLCSLRLDNKEKYHYSLLYTLLFVSVFMVVTSVGVVIAAPDIIRVLLGEKWLGSIPILQILVLAIPFHATSLIVTLHFDASNQLYTKMAVESIMLVVLGIGTFLLYPYGILGIVSIVVILEVVRALLYFFIFVVRTSVQGKDLFIFVKMYLFATLVVGGLILSVSTFLPVSMLAGFRLVCEIIAGVVGLLIVIALSGRILTGLSGFDYFLENVPQKEKLMGYLKMLKFWNRTHTRV